MMNNKRFLLLFAVFLFSIVLVSAQDANKNYTQTDALNCLNESIQIMQDMGDESFNVNRINDSIIQAQSLYNSQVILLEKRKKADFSLVINYCNDILKIREDSILARDEFSALMRFYNDSIVEGMNTETISAIISEIQTEIDSERYENVKPIVDKAYSEIINVKSSYTAVNLFVGATTRGIKIFISNNWKVLTFFLVSALVLFLIYRIRILRWIIEKQIKNLQLRKKTLKELIMKTQKDYFQFGKIAEGEYNIKTKKFAELVRDIDRQIPLLNEELIKLERAGKFWRSKVAREEKILEIKKDKKKTSFLGFKSFFHKKKAEKTKIKASKKRRNHK